MQEMAAPFKDRRPKIVPPIPEHVRPNNAADDIERYGVVWCMRCGTVLWTEKYGDKKNLKDCRVVHIGLR